MAKSMLKRETHHQLPMTTQLSRSSRLKRKMKHLVLSNMEMRKLQTVIKMSQDKALIVTEICVTWLNREEVMEI